jgi:KipI family sensor histidine kinase inhibitor
MSHAPHSPTPGPLRRAGFTVHELGDRALLLRWPQRIDAGINDAVHACAHRLQTHAPPWLQAVVPAYSSLALLLDLDQFPDGTAPLQKARRWLQSALSAGRDAPAAGHRVIDVPVRYGGADGPDLAQVAVATGMSAADVVALHSAPLYRVAMLGFAPGFPYLLGLDPRLAVPRLAVPRQRVPAGSVGIGGEQTGIYPQAGPGGWQVIGRTTLALFDPAAEAPTLLQPGDRLRFVPVAHD